MIIYILCILLGLVIGIAITVVAHDLRNDLYKVQQQQKEHERLELKLEVLKILQEPMHEINDKIHALEQQIGELTKK